MYSIGEEFIRDLARILGVSGRPIRKITITAEKDCSVIVKIEELLPQDNGDKVLTLVTKAIGANDVKK